MTDKKKSLGQAIDEIVNALSGVDAKDQLVAIQAACSHLSVKIMTSTNSVQATPGQAPAFQTPPSPLSAPATLLTPNNQQGPIDIRMLKDQKQPKSAIEMACIVAFYLQNLAPESERAAQIAADDLDKYFKQASYPVPKVVNQLLPDAKSAGYFDSVGRGTYKLNPVGYNLVAHGLPREEGNKSNRQSRPKKKAPAKKKAKK